MKGTKENESSGWKTREGERCPMIIENSERKRRIEGSRRQEEDDEVVRW